MGFFPKRSIPGFEYLLARAEAETELAERAVDQHAADAHHKLADSYLGQLFGDDAGQMTPFDRTKARPENRKAMLDIFARYAEKLDRQLSQSPDELTALLDRLSADSGVIKASGRH
jgi:hypothetical protein